MYDSKSAEEEDILSVHEVSPVKRVLLHFSYPILP